MFFFFIKETAMLGKDKANKEFEFMEHLELPAFEYFIQRFMKNANFNHEELDFMASKDIFVEKFDDRADQKKLSIVPGKKQSMKTT